MADDMFFVKGKHGKLHWDQIEGKPEGGGGSNIPMTRGIKSITWDGDATGKETTSFGSNEAVFVRITENVLSSDDVIGGKVTLSMQGVANEIPIKNDSVIQVAEGIAFVMFNETPLVFLCSKDGCEFNGATFNKGVYFLGVEPYVMVNALAYYGEVIDKSVIPQDVSCDWKHVSNRPFGDEIAAIEWDGDTTDRIYVQHTNDADQRFYKVSSETPSAESVTGNEIKHTDANVTANAMAEENGWYNATPAIFCAFTSGAKIGSWTFPEPGVYFHHNSASDGAKYVTRLEYTAATNRLNEKYMPILTSPNGTKYAISVADDGTLSAVAVE